MAYNTTTRKILYHQSTNPGAPSDWEYDPVADTWTRLASVGSGATSEQALAFDPVCNCLIGWSNNPVNSGVPDIWIGRLGTATADAIQPTVSITTPAPASNVSGKLLINATASDNVGVASVQFKVNGALIYPEDYSFPYSITWDSRTVVNGSHSITAVARDAAGNTITSAPVTVTVNNSPDTTPPVRSNGWPAAALPYGTSRTTLSLDTDEIATCRMSTVPGTAYSAMSSAMVATGGTRHALPTPPLSNNQSYTFYVRCQDTAGNANTNDYPIAMSVAAPDVTPPAISAIGLTSLTPYTATVSWTTNEVSDSQLEYGLTASYGTVMPLNPSTVLLHKVNLSNLTPETTYHFRVKSRDAAGNLSVSGDRTFKTSPVVPILNTVFRIAGEPTELSGTADGAVVTPSTTPAGVTGRLRVSAPGAVRFAPATVGNGVFFQNCCSHVGSAHYRFLGTGLGSIFNSNEGEVSFSLTSTRTWAQRQATPFRTVFGVEDTAGNYLFSFVVSPGSFAYRAGSFAADYYFWPRGQEDEFFGIGKTLNIRLVWNGFNRFLYVNEVLVRSTTYTAVAPAWAADSVFTFGGANYNGVASNVSDDIIDEFTIKQ
jgi:hypothetical protein